MKVITVTGYKGGVGKSTVSLHLANYLSSVGKTILIDGDQNGTCLSRAEHNLLSFDVYSRFDNIVNSGDIYNGVQYLIVDTPARPVPEDLQDLLSGTNLAVLPTCPAIDTLKPLLSLIKDISFVNYRVLINMVPPYPSKAGVELYEDLVVEKVPVFKQFIRRTVAFDKASLAGVCVDKVGGNRLAWSDFKEVGKELMELL